MSRSQLVCLMDGLFFGLWHICQGVCVVGQRKPSSGDSIEIVKNGEQSFVLVVVELEFSVSGILDQLQFFHEERCVLETLLADTA